MEISHVISIFSILSCDDNENTVYRQSLQSHLENGLCLITSRDNWGYSMSVNETELANFDYVGVWYFCPYVMFSAGFQVFSSSKVTLVNTEQASKDNITVEG